MLSILEQHKFPELEFLNQTLIGIRDSIINDVNEEQHSFGLQISAVEDLTMRQINSYSDDFIALQLKTTKHKVIVQLKEQVSIKEKEIQIPNCLLQNLCNDIEFEIRKGVDNIKFEMLLKASLSEKSLNNKEKSSIEASVKRAYEFFTNHSETFFKKKLIQENLKILISLFFVSNMPCSHRHYLAIKDIVSRLLENPQMIHIKDECLTEMESLKYFSNNLIVDVEIQLKEQIKDKVLS